MIQIKITEKQKAALYHARYNHPHPHVQKKMDVLYLKSFGKLSHELICEIVGITPNTMRTYLKQYQEGGIKKLKEINFYRPQSDLAIHARTIETYIKERPPATISEAVHMIEQLTGVKRSMNRTRVFIKSLGVKFLKVGTIPAKALEENKKKSKQYSWKMS